MATLMMLLAGLLIAFANFFMRRSIDAGGSSRAYLVVQLSLSLVVGIALGPFSTGDYGLSTPSLVLGLVGGVILGLMMWCLGRGLETGPAGVTIAALNSGTVVPGIAMAIIFGPFWGHNYHLSYAIGSVAVIGGLFWAGWGTESHHAKLKWVFYVAVSFVMHAMLLTFLEWRALLFKGPWDVSKLVPFRLDASSTQWFMPLIFLVAVLIQLGSYLRHEKRWPNSKEVYYGLLGGIFNGGCTYLLIIAPSYATPIENAMMYPLFAVTVIVLCNLWGQGVYKEKINWVASGICLAGLFVGLVDWQTLFTGCQSVLVCL